MHATPSKRAAPCELSERQSLVLRAVVSSYVGAASPVASETIATVLPVSLSSASVRTTLAELADLGLVEKPHASAGRIPSERGLRVYVDQLLAPQALGGFERRDLAGILSEAEEVAQGLERQGVASLESAASRILSERTRQLGFAAVPRLDRIRLRHVSFVRVSSDRVLAILISHTGTTYRRVLQEPGTGDQAELDRMAAALNECVAGNTLGEVREGLARGAEVLRSQASRVLDRALRLGLRVLDRGAEAEDLVFATRLALLDQPEFRDPERLRQLWEAVEAQEKLLAVIDQVLEQGKLTVTFGDEVDEPTLQNCAMVAAPYGDADAPLGVIGVIGPSRMDYARVIPVVDYLSHLVTGRFRA